MSKHENKAVNATQPKSGGSIEKRGGYSGSQPASAMGRPPKAPTTPTTSGESSNK